MGRTRQVQKHEKPNQSRSKFNHTWKRALYQALQSCHGPKGLGDGPKAANLKTKMRSFTSAEFKAQKPVLFIINLLSDVMRCQILRKKFWLKRTLGNY
jgi:hypothetical protein